MKKAIFKISALLFLFTSCSEGVSPEGIDVREEMRSFVIGLSQYSKSIKSNFFIIPQNGIELVVDKNEQPHQAYLNAIDGNGQESLFYGYNRDDRATPNNESDYILPFLDVSKNAGNSILVTDYCSTPSKMEDSYSKNNNQNYVSFSADHRELDNIPNYPAPIVSENNAQITHLSEIQNFLYLINPENYNSKADFINAVTATNYDLLLMDLFFDENTEFTNAEINQLRKKANGGSRLVIAYMSIGEAEDYRYYWNNNWNSTKPEWLDKENPDWDGNFKVKYWEQDWQDIIYGNDNSYLKKILDAGFDGTYLDIIDGFEYYE